MWQAAENAKRRSCAVVACSRYDLAMKHIGLICLVCPVVILGLFFANQGFAGQYTDGLTKAVLFASFVVSLLAIAFNAGRRAELIALFVNLAGLGLVGSIVDHL